MALPGLDKGQVAKAVRSLLTYIGQQQEKSTQLFDDDELIYMLISLKRMPGGPRKDKPIALPVPHALYSPEGAEICLFVKDHAGEGHKEAKKRVESIERRAGIAKVVGLSKLRTKYESHEAKRQLCNSFDLFLADERVLPSLPKLIGKSFFKKKKQPIPVDLTKKDWAGQVKRACAATYLYPSTGTSLNIRVARSGMAADEVATNVEAALAAAVEHVPKKWSNVQAVFLKTADSVALPIYQTLPDAPTKIGLTPTAATTTTTIAAPSPVAAKVAAAAATPGPATAAGKKRPAASSAKTTPATTTTATKKKGIVGRAKNVA